MFGKRITLFKILGFEVHIDLSWLLLAFLVTWTLAVGYFPMQHRGLTTATYWWMGVAGALGLFVSIVVHEFAHSIVARRFGIPMKGITLFIFGGVAEMTKEPPNPKSEFFMAIAGPLASVVISLCCFLLAGVSATAQGPMPVTAVFGYLAWINFVLVLFNMVPAFPLDGGRVLRSALWAAKGNLHWATRISSAIGSGFGILLVILGIFSFVNGNLIGGLWWLILGIFLRNASRMSFEQLLLREALAGEPVRHFMRENPITVPSSATIRDVVDRYVYRYHHKLFPVVDDGALVGCITINRIKEVPREEWDRRTVGEMARGCDSENTVSPDTDTVRALARMHRTGASRLLVVDHGRLAGILSLKDLLQFLAMKIELEGDSPR
jgi:Zn-dependent protease/predicted transcriptional regulator